MISKEELVSITESSIDSLVSTFRETPYFFYTENDLHMYLYNEISGKLSLEDWKCRTKDGKLSILLHKEYPTKERYSARALKPKKEGARGHFDLCIWNPVNTGERKFRADAGGFNEEQHTFIVIEFGMIERNYSLEAAVHHLKWDLLKLGDSKNEVEHGYCLVFARDWSRSKEFLKKIRQEIEKNRKTVVLYAEKNRKIVTTSLLSDKPFPGFKSLH